MKAAAPAALAAAVSSCRSGRGAYIHRGCLATPMWLVLVGLLMAGRAYAVEIIRLEHENVIINAGAKDGLAMGDEICITEPSGSVLGCGTITVLRPRRAGVVVDSWLVPQLAVGMTVVAKGHAKGGAGTEAVKSSAKNSKDKSKGIAKTRRRDARLSPRVALDYVYLARTVFTYGLPLYDLASEERGVGPLWRRDQTVGSGASGGELSVGWSVHKGWLFVPVLRYQSKREDVSLGDYVRNDGATHLEATTESSASGGGLTARHVWTLGRAELQAGGGVDVDRSQVRFAAVQKTSLTDTRIIDASSTLVVTSARLDLRAEVAWGPMGFGLGAVGLLPVAGTSNAKSGERHLKDSVSTGQALAASDDLTAALAHRRAKYGAAVTAGLRVRF